MNKTNSGDILYILIQSTLMYLKFVLCINIPLLLVFSPTLLILTISFFIANSMIQQKKEKK